MTPSEIVRIAEPYTNRMSDAFRMACGVPLRVEWHPHTLIRGDDYDAYRERLRRGYG